MRVELSNNNYKYGFVNIAMGLNKGNILRKNLENSYLSEEMEKSDLEMEGWEVERLFEKKDVEGVGWRSIFRHSEIKEFLQGTNKERIAEELLIKLQELTHNKQKLPDFICKKNGKVKFVEVKNCKQLKGPSDIAQQKAIEELWGCFKIETELRNLVIDKQQADRILEDYCNKTGNEIVNFEIEQKGNGELILTIKEGCKIKDIKKNNTFSKE